MKYQALSGMAMAATLLERLVAEAETSMADPEREPLEGVVEVDRAEISSGPTAPPFDP